MRQLLAGAAYERSKRAEPTPPTVWSAGRLSLRHGQTAEGQTPAAAKKRGSEKYQSGAYSWWEASGRGRGRGEARAGRGFGQVSLFSTASPWEALMTWGQKWGRKSPTSREKDARCGSVTAASNRAASPSASLIGGVTGATAGLATTCILEQSRAGGDAHPAVLHGSATVTPTTLTR